MMMVVGKINHLMGGVHTTAQMVVGDIKMQMEVAHTTAQMVVGDTKTTMGFPVHKVYKEIVKFAD